MENITPTILTDMEICPTCYDKENNQYLGRKIMIIRNAKINDINQMIPLMFQVAQMHYYKRKDIFKEKGVEEIKLELKDRLENNENILVAEENNSIVGVIIFKIKVVKEHVNLIDRKVMWIDELVVDKNLRGKGIGKRLFDEAKKYAKNNECDDIELNCWNFNENALKFYEKCGMTTQRKIMELKL